MSTKIPHDENPRARYILYGVAIGVALALLVVMVISYTGNEADKEATAKAETLSAEIKAAGYEPPDTDAIARVLGTDGGAVCDDPGDLSRGMLKLTFTNGAAGPGLRPVRIDRVVVAGERLIIQTYCPDELQDFDDFVDSLDFSDVSHS